jgi:hypothetical protein
MFTHGSRLKSQRGVIDIIFGDVLVVVARFFATDVVTLRCKRFSDMVQMLTSRYERVSPVKARDLSKTTVGPSPCSWLELRWSGRPAEP